MARPFSRRAGQPRTRGQALVEVALVLPVFLVMLMLLFDFGRVVYALNTINQDAREGVRRGIVSTAGVADFQGLYDDIRAAALVMAPAVPISAASIYGADGACALTPADTTVTVVSPLATCFYPNGVTNANPLAPAKVVVRIQVTVDLITPIIGNIVGDGITLNATAEQLIQS